MDRLDHAVRALNRAYLRDYPDEAARSAGLMPKGELVAVLTAETVPDAIALWEALPGDTAADVLDGLPTELLAQLLSRSEAVRTARLLTRLPAAERERLLAPLDAIKRRELEDLARYAEDSAGALMDTHFLPLSDGMTVREVLQRIRKIRPRFTRQLFLVDHRGRLCRMVELHALAIADPAARLSAVAKPVPQTVLPTAGREEIVAAFDTQTLTDLPVVDIEGCLLGVVRYDALIEVLREESSADIQTMVGASKDERALSAVGFVVRKRLPWLHINLVTAFLAAAVVGLFEGTIARFTALAVLLPVVAGQSGNTGAQALAVTMRGLALHEIGTSHWRRVARKEVGAALINGVAVALVTALGVWVWSASVGLSLVIGVSMVISMVAAGFSGVIIPVALSAVGQDLAQSSSIILTTVTDVVGFFTFLGIATLLASLL